MILSESEKFQKARLPSTQVFGFWEIRLYSKVSCFFYTISVLIVSRDDYFYVLNSINFCIFRAKLWMKYCNREDLMAKLSNENWHKSHKVCERPSKASSSLQLVMSESVYCQMPTQHCFNHFLGKQQNHLKQFRFYRVHPLMLPFLNHLLYFHL